MTTATKKSETTGQTTAGSPNGAPAAKSTTAKPNGAARSTKAKAAAEDAAASAFSFGGAALNGTAREQYEAVFKAFSENAEEMQGRTQEWFDATRDGLSVAQAKMHEVNVEAMDMARQEMADAAQFANDLAKSGSFFDALDVQRAYFTQLFDSRIERSRHMTQTAVDAMRSTAEPFQKTMKATMATGTTANFFSAFFPGAQK